MDATGGASHDGAVVLLSGADGRPGGLHHLIQILFHKGVIAVLMSPYPRPLPATHSFVRTEELGGKVFMKLAMSQYLKGNCLNNHL